VIPVYKARDCLGELYRRLVQALESLDPDFELVLVEDDGQDGSWEEIASLAERDPRVKGIRLSRNFGQHYAISAGLDHAFGDWVVVMDCDLQDQPEEIEKLYRKAQEGFEMVFARRIDRKDARTKSLRSHLFGRVLSWLMDAKFDETVANFSVSSQKAVRAYREYRERDRAFFMIMRDIGFSCAFADVDHGARYAGTTSYSLRKLIAFATQVIVSTSTRPLHLSIRFGAIVASMSLAYAVYLIGRRVLVNVGVAGWTSLAVLISLFFGLLFIQLGIIGLYLGKTFEESKRRPLYHVAEYRNYVSGE